MNNSWRFLILLLLPIAVNATQPDQKNLPIGLAPFEVGIPLERAAPATPPPPAGRIHSLAEWEEAESVMTLWSNPSLVSALAAHGKVSLLTDDDSGKEWWTNWLNSNHIPKEKVSFLFIPTDSMWIRDYGPWFILDGKGQFGIVDTIYNRPRPKDDLGPQVLGEQLHLPVYQPGLVHTGGNYYNDGLGNGFSSTLVYTENSEIPETEVQARMKEYLGIDRYVTSPLAPGITIEHLDTFGKLVTPDTWVFSDFPEGSHYRTDSEAMVALLKQLKSPYGTPYRVFRMKMTPKPHSGSTNFRAYLNSFISNHALYFPIYGDSKDNEAKAIYQAALPGYDIVGVDAQNTSWGDSVHCRTRNLLEKDTLFIFPHVEQAGPGQPLKVEAEVIPSPGAELNGLPSVNWRVGEETHVTPLIKQDPRVYVANLPVIPRGTKVSLVISAQDSKGITKTAPRFPSSMTIDFEVQ